MGCPPSIFRRQYGGFWHHPLNILFIIWISHSWRDLSVRNVVVLIKRKVKAIMASAARFVILVHLPSSSTQCYQANGYGRMRISMLLWIFDKNVQLKRSGNMAISADMQMQPTEPIWDGWWLNCFWLLDHANGDISSWGVSTVTNMNSMFNVLMRSMAISAHGMCLQLLISRASTLWCCERDDECNWHIVEENRPVCICGDNNSDGNASNYTIKENDRYFNIKSTILAH